MRNVQDGFVHDRLHVQAGAGEEKLFVWLERRVDSGIDRGLSVFEAEVGVRTQGEGHAYVPRLVRDDACSESGRKVAPVAAGCSMIRRIWNWTGCETCAREAASVLASCGCGILAQGGTAGYDQERS